jgi:hypothetical protein
MVVWTIPRSRRPLRAGRENRGDVKIKRHVMPKVPLWLIVIIPCALAVSVGGALSQQDRYTVQVPDGLAFSEFKGYETWQLIAVSKTEDLLVAILGNPEMIAAYQAGIPGNGKPFPDGAKMAKIHWNMKQSAEAPAPTTIPDTLHDIDFMVRDSKRFADSGNWGYAQFNYDSASGTFTPLGTGANCGFACHTIVKAKDYVFTAYPKR